MTVQELNQAMLQTLIREEPTLFDVDDEAIKRASFVLAHLLGTVLALACARHGDDAYDGFAQIAKRQIDKSATNLSQPQKSKAHMQ